MMSAGGSAGVPCIVDPPNLTPEMRHAEVIGNHEMAGFMHGGVTAAARLHSIDWKH